MTTNTNEADTAIEAPAAATETVVEAAAEDTTILGAASTDGATDPAAAADANADDADGAAVAGDDGSAAEADLAKPYEGLNAPEGTTLDEETMALAGPMMREFGVPDDKAQAFLDKAAPIMARAGEVAVGQFVQAQTDAVNERAAQWANELRADPEIGGAKYDETVAMAAKARDTLFTPEFRTFLNESKLGNHPEMLRGLAKAGRQIADDTIIIPTTAGKSAPKTLGQAMYGDMKPVSPE